MCNVFLMIKSISLRKVYVFYECVDVFILWLVLLLYSGTSPYGHLSSKVTSPLRSPLLGLKLYSTVQRIGRWLPCNIVTSLLRSLLSSPMGDRIREVPLYLLIHCIALLPVNTTEQIFTLESSE